MAIRVNVPRDLSRVKEKVAFNLTKRQLICFTLAGMIGVPTFLSLNYLRNYLIVILKMFIG